MITIITGTPGNGKTAHAIDLLWFQNDSMWRGLDRYVDGVADLKLEHFELPPISEVKHQGYTPLSSVDSDEYAVWLPSHPQYAEFVQHRATAKSSFELWFLWAQKGSVIFVDEAQRYLRPKAAGSAVPFHIQLLEYHRHFGIHFVFVTQKEGLLHSNVRALCGQHIHLTDGWRGRMRFEWPEVKDTTSKAEKKLSAHTSYKLPIHVFPYYQSAVQHLTVKHKTPFFFKMMIGGGLLVIGSAFLAFKQFAAPRAVSAPAVSVADLPASAVVVSDVRLGVLDEFERFVPAVAGRPETAPAYDALRQVVAMPIISACLRSARSCYCYTQQGTKIADVSPDSCAQYLDQGAAFNPYASPSENSQNPSASGFDVSGDGSGSTVAQRLVMEPVTASELPSMLASQ